MAPDPLRYYRIEARELLGGLSQGVLDLEKGGFNRELITKLLRFAHTLKGASRVVKQNAVAERAHALEDALAPYREGPGPVAREHIAQLLANVDAISALLAALSGLEAPVVSNQETPRPALAEESLATVRVELKEMDLLLEGFTETRSQFAALHANLDMLKQARQLADQILYRLSATRSQENNGYSNLGSLARLRPTVEELQGVVSHTRRDLEIRLEKIESELTALSDLTRQLRLLPAGQVFGLLERAVRDAAQSLKRRVRFEISGGETRLDAHVLFDLRDALLHVVRNAVAHGIEPEAERAAAGKTPEGLVQVRVERRGNRAAFICKDDGRGVDVAAVRNAAVKKGRLTTAQSASLPWDELVRLLLGGGLSTSTTVTDVSGRGIGMDVVRDTVSKLKGEVRIQSEPGRGTSVELLVPVSLASMNSIVVRSGPTLASIPRDSVLRTLRVTSVEIARSADGESLSFEGHSLPFLPLSQLLDPNTHGETKSAAHSVVVIQSEGDLVALGVDGVVGANTIIMRPLPPYIEAHPAIAGISLDIHGSPQLVLDPMGIVRAARVPRVLAAPVAIQTAKPILVVDDSLTTRMLEQTILESAGFTVELATSAEEALDKARERDYGLFLVDVEMPGMDGFEFVARTRKDPKMGLIPAILVTSRNAPEDQKRGYEMGASAYIVKGDFDQGNLLKTIRQLLG